MRASRDGRVVFGDEGMQKDEVARCAAQSLIACNSSLAAWRMAGIEVSVSFN